ncbi:MAG: hypothetical protein V4590_00825, partial [Bacteroidota bacterium]
MYKTLLLSILFGISLSIFAQTPQKMSYQSVVRDSTGKLIVNKFIGLRISILQHSITGTIVYTESQRIKTNSNGLFSTEIGGGTSFNSINWANGPYFFKTETDPNDGTNYSISGISQLLSVPFALLSEKALVADAAKFAQKSDSSAFSTKATQAKFADSTAFAMKSDSAAFSTKATWAKQSDSTIFANKSDSAAFSAKSAWAKLADTATFAKKSDSAAFSTKATWAKQSDSTIFA